MLLDQPYAISMGKGSHGWKRNAGEVLPLRCFLAMPMPQTAWRRLANGGNLLRNPGLQAGCKPRRSKIQG